MARIKNKIMEGTSGKLGDVVFKVINGNTHVCAVPERDPNRKPTSGQLAAMEKFKRRSEYCTKAIADPVLRPLYEAAAKKHKPAYMIAFKDAVHAPEVHRIHSVRNRNGVREFVYIQATDDFKVKEVKVSIVSAKGKFIEEGNAIQQKNSDTWIYETKKRGEIIAGAKIKAVATDLPGNRGELELTLS